MLHPLPRRMPRLIPLHPAVRKLGRLLPRILIHTLPKPGRHLLELLHRDRGFHVEHALLPMVKGQFEVGPLALAVFLLGGAEDGVRGVEVGEFGAEDGGDGGLAEAVAVLGFEPAA